MNSLTLIIAWSVHNANLYAQWAEIPRPYKIVTRPEQIQGVADGTRIIWLDSRTDHYPPVTVAMIRDALGGRTSGLEYDSTDRFLTPTVRQDFPVNRGRNAPTRQQADNTFIAALRGDDTTAAMVREWATYAGQRYEDHDDDTACTIAAVERARRSGKATVLAQRGCPCHGAHYSGPNDTQCRWCPCHQTEQQDPQTEFTADMARAAMSRVRDRAVQSTWEGNWAPGDPDPDDADYSANAHIPTHRMPPGPAVPAAAPVPPPVPASGHYAEPRGWGDVPRIPDEPTGDALYSDPCEYQPDLFPGERPVW